MLNGIEIGPLGFRTACANGSCVEVARAVRESVHPDSSHATETGYVVRDSKNPDPANVQFYTEEEWADFTRGVRAGTFDFG